MKITSGSLLCWSLISNSYFLYTNAFSQFEENIEEMNPDHLEKELVPSGTSPAEGVPIPSVQEGANSVDMECQGHETLQPCTELTSP